MNPGRLQKDVRHGRLRRKKGFPAHISKSLRCKDNECARFLAGVLVRQQLPDQAGRSPASRLNHDGNKPEEDSHRERRRDLQRSRRLAQYALF